MVVFMLLYINSKLNSFSNALIDISNKIDISEENPAPQMPMGGGMDGMM